ncbi:hypothetical protein EI42_00238 [Thermosporothrix hazakensis]|jgi:small-conductance mechanosensitive channel|uniref:Uncharacterized protein n=2 Tax=Thermosporothrix TaxID=768650 RepID=A0A326UCC4_THEHA|nr:hypothetical protein [Thermosporothrix hazakensis]PZW36068.1 hypothetical protein EI42_00238 [Thermosporothrix hazakensis]BBH88534.1 hypothetical protein KTC_32850 [Thermosporothrix sp. COM3]GCE46719.1 hypothetical protein KTH_15880 [Thermosporothrix hazakensis]
MDPQLIFKTLYQILTQILDFLPRMVNGLVILLVGYLLSWAVRRFLSFLLVHLRVEQLATRAGITGALQGLGIRTPLSRLLAQIVFFFLLLSFATSAVQLMGLSTVADLLQRVLQFIPVAISAGLIIIFGSMLARFVGTAVGTVARGANISYGGALGRFLEYLLMTLVVVLAISTIGVDTTVLTTSFTILIAAIGLAIALTFAWGAREAARNVIAGYYVRQRWRPGQWVRVGEYQGEIHSVVGAFTLLEAKQENGERKLISLPKFPVVTTGVNRNRARRTASRDAALALEEERERCSPLLVLLNFSVFFESL